MSGHFNISVIWMYKQGKGISYILEYFPNTNVAGHFCLICVPTDLNCSLLCFRLPYGMRILKAFDGTLK